MSLKKKSKLIRVEGERISVWCCLIKNKKCSGLNVKGRQMAKDVGFHGRSLCS